MLHVLKKISMILSIITVISFCSNLYANDDIDDNKNEIPQNQFKYKKEKHEIKFNKTTNKQKLFKELFQQEYQEYFELYQKHSRTLFIEIPKWLMGNRIISPLLRKNENLKFVSLGQIVDKIFTCNNKIKLYNSKRLYLRKHENTIKMLQEKFDGVYTVKSQGPLQAKFNKTTKFLKGNHDIYNSLKTILKNAMIERMDKEEDSKKEYSENGIVEE